MSRVCSSRGEMDGDGPGTLDQRVRVGVGWGRGSERVVGCSTSLAIGCWVGGREGFGVIGVRWSFSSSGCLCIFGLVAVSKVKSHCIVWQRYVRVGIETTENEGTTRFEGVKLNKQRSNLTL